MVSIVGRAWKASRILLAHAALRKAVKVVIDKTAEMMRQLAAWEKTKWSVDKT
jgi:hypothetical protein